MMAPHGSEPVEATEMQVSTDEQKATSGRTSSAPMSALIMGAVNIAALIVGAGIAWGVNRQSVADIQNDTARIHSDVKALVDQQAAMNTRLTLLETHKQMSDERVNTMAATLKDIDSFTRALHDNVLILCQHSPAREHCKK